MKHTGIVKWFSNEKKYGFITCEGRELFVHFSAIMKEGYKTLKKGEMVQFEIISGDRGDMAVGVVSFHEKRGSK